MARKYNYSRTRKGAGSDETFSVDGCDSFNEAVKMVDEGIYRYDLLKKEQEEREEKEVKAEPVPGPEKEEKNEEDTVPNIPREDTVPNTPPKRTKSFTK